MSNNTPLYYPTDLVIKLGNYCPNNCQDGKYCFAENTPQGKTWVNRDRIPDILQQAKNCGLVNLLYFSAEPFADFNLLLFVTKTASDVGLKPRFLDTSGYQVGKTLDTAEDHFKRLRDAGFDFTVEEDYIGTQYNGIDVSVDQFHPIPAEQCANTIRGAVHVFGPTDYLGMRVTHPNPPFNDNSKKNRTIELLINSGEVIGTNTERHEIYFVDGSTVNLIHLRMHDSGFARQLAKEQPGMFYRSSFTMEDLKAYKDLRERLFFGGEQIIEPFHKLYLDPDGQTYPCLSRLPVLSGGNAYTKSIQQIIEDTNANPLLPVLIAEGLAGILKLVEQKTGRKPILYATGPSTVGNEFLENAALMEQIKAMVSQKGIDNGFRSQMIHILRDLRGRISTSNQAKDH